ncbi:hypothetical protein [Colwellia echini]|uniref:Uncharacterized protein n=1 Tax=Colwellia echini TaxID=1982103 RepID=A0ABY3MSQ4_9GAMM|nr:hypothetical protein [Colwellia echini]TYK64167.1 hypothetical protein CWS31_017120 [Colwellia echini]
MKFFLAVLLLVNFKVVACGQDYLKGYSDKNKFLVAVELADFVYIGEVARTYRLPNTHASQKNDNGYVFKVIELLKGETQAYMETEQSSHCGISGPFSENYWPNSAGQEFVVAGKSSNDNNYVFAVYPFNKAVYVMGEILNAANKQFNRDQ